MWRLFFKGKIGIMKKSSQKFVSPLYISIDYEIPTELSRAFSIVIAYVAFN